MSVRVRADVVRAGRRAARRALRARLRQHGARVHDVRRGPSRLHVAEPRVPPRAEADARARLHRARVHQGQ